MIEVWEGMKGRVVLCSVAESKKKGVLLYNTSQGVGSHRGAGMDGFQDSTGNWKLRILKYACQCEKWKAEGGDKKIWE